ncbi:TIGR02710 family CRISPR-associated protein [Candidatus Pacearchaeota archaeon]|nr:TIGR02710 family CRISPR-associated protein [Candidatus Pacearchaeota archaeon]
MEFDELRNKWLELVRLTKLDEADSIYWNDIFPVVEKRFLEQNKIQGYDWLILPSGLEVSYYILLIKAINPKNIYFLGTKEFKEHFLDKIIAKTGIKPSQYIIDTLDYNEMDVADVYNKIRERLDLFYNKKVILDLTRGKRIMSVGAGIVGAFFGFDLVYIDEDWLDDIKRGMPGTEKLVPSKNPFDVFGDLEGQEARELFNNYNYGAALFFYKRLKEKVADFRKIEIEEIMSEAYLHWNSFNFKAAFSKFELLIRKSSQYNIKLDSRLLNNFEVIKILGSLDTGNPEKIDDISNLHIIIDLYANSLRKAEIHSFDDALSRLYRVLELISQYRLRSYGIETSRPELKNITEDYKKIVKDIYGIEKDTPLEIGLKDGYIFLYILKDYIVENDTLDDLRKMFGVIRTRDTSIIAHGLQLAGENAFKSMDVLAKKYINRLCIKLGISFENILKQHTFIKLSF